MADMRDIQKVVQFHTNSGPAVCEECDAALGSHGSGPIARGINHYLTEHNYVLLHVGSEWGNDRDGKSITHTVAFLGKPGTL